jgi:hypothetical protein
MSSSWKRKDVIFFLSDDVGGYSALNIFLEISEKHKLVKNLLKFWPIKLFKLRKLLRIESLDSQTAQI